jgi:ABC-type branched-subunit amino acid transport system substrate-binding protein
VTLRLRGYHQGALVYGACIVFEELRLQPDRKLILTKQIRNLIGFVLASLALAACSPDAEIQSPGISDDAILIGSSSALTGHASFLGSQYTLGSKVWFNGSKVWFNEVNAAGGIHGRKIDFLTYDDAYEPDKTVANSRRLIAEDRVFMLFDYVGTPTSVQIIDMIHDEDIPAFGFLTGAELLRTPFRPNTFHVRASYYHEAEGAVAYFVDHLGFEKIAVMYQDDAFGLAVLAGVQLSMRRRGLEIIAIDSFTRGSLELDRPVETISNSGADAVILVGTYSPLAKFIKGVHDVGHRPYFHTVSFVGSKAFGTAILEEGVDGSQFDRIIVTQVVPSPYSEDLETVREYQAQLAQHFPEETPNFVSLEGYINARALTRILSETGRNLSRKTMKQTIESMSRIDVGIGMPLTFGLFDHSGLDDIFYSRLGENGLFTVFDLPSEEPSEHAVAR